MVLFSFFIVILFCCMVTPESPPLWKLPVVFGSERSLEAVCWGPRGGVRITQTARPLSVTPRRILTRWHYWEVGLVEGSGSGVTLGTASCPHSLLCTSFSAFCLLWGELVSVPHAPRCDALSHLGPEATKPDGRGLEPSKPCTRVDLPTFSCLEGILSQWRRAGKHAVRAYFVHGVPFSCCTSLCSVWPSYPVSRRVPSSIFLSR